MELVRIGDKVVSRKKIDRVIDEILEQRSAGRSQAEVAQRLGVDRTFISRLEGLGEVRKGRRLAVVGFPVANVEELREVLEAEGVEFVFLMTEAERWEFVKSRSGVDLLNSVMELIAQAHSYDQVIVIGSGKRIKIIEAVLDKEVVGYELGESPLRQDVYVNPDEIVALVRTLKA